MQRQCARGERGVSHSENRNKHGRAVATSPIQCFAYTPQGCCNDRTTRRVLLLEQ